MRKRFQKTSIVLDEPIEILNLATTGQGISEMPDGMKVFLWNALPGEKVSEFLMTKKKAHFLEGIATKIEKISKNRIEPKDAHYLSTSPWQIMSESYEKEAKEKILNELFLHELNENLDIKLNQAGSAYFYRNKMEYALYFDNEDGKIHLAVHERGSHKKVPIKTSSIELPAIYEYAKKVVDDLNEKHEEARKYQSLLLRANQKGEVSGGLFENKKPHPTFENLEDELLGKKYSYSPNGFFQINLPVYELALKYIKNLIEKTKENYDSITDLYSGVGTIGLSVAGDKKLTLVEVDKNAYAELEENVKKSGSKTATPILAKSEDALDFVTENSIVILDPPRAGCDKKLIDKLLKVHPKKIIYLSCNPITQARDVALLLENESFKIESATAFNFFPRTPHIESLISLI